MTVIKQLQEISDVSSQFNTILYTVFSNSEIPYDDSQRSQRLIIFSTKKKNVVPIKKLKHNLFLSFPSVKITVRPKKKKKDHPTNYFPIHTLIYPSYLILIFTSKFSTNSNYMFNISSYSSFSSLLIPTYLYYFCSILQF